jgi:hypothetical protein
MLIVLVLAVGVAAVITVIAGFLTKNTFVLAVGIALLIGIAIFVAFDEAMIHCRPPNCI